MLQKYRSITGENFYLQETRRFAKELVLNSYIFDNTLRANLEKNNSLETSTTATFNKKFTTISKRLKTLPNELILLLSTSDSTCARNIIFYSILLNERFIREFYQEVYLQLVDSKISELSDKNIKDFILRKREENEDIENWSPSGKKKMMEKCKNFLLEGGYLSYSNRSYKCVKVILSKDFLDFFNDKPSDKILQYMKKGE